MAPMRRGRQHQDDDERADRQPDHRHAAEHARGDRDDGGHGDDGRENAPPIAPQQDERDALEDAGFAR